MPTRRDTLVGLGSTFAAGLGGCVPQELPSAIEIHAPQARNLFEGSNGLEQLAEGFTWCESPSWDRARQCLYFTDVPGNRAYRWSNSSGLDVFLDPSGVDESRATGMREPGANGLWYGQDGWLYLCNHGERAVQKISLDNLERETLVDQFEGQKFNSPNDLVQAADGTIFFEQKVSDSVK